MKPMHIANKLASKVDEYHSKGKKAHPASMGAMEPDHDALESIDKDQVDDKDVESLEESMCPGCHDKLRAHVIAKKSGSKSPISE